MSNHTNLQIKRIYEDPTDEDGYRVLVDRLWPRGVSKEDAQLDEWMKEITPSPESRKWFDHDPDKFEEFKKRYEHELASKDEPVEKLLDLAEEKKSYAFICRKGRDTQSRYYFKRLPGETWMTRNKGIL